MQNGGEGGGVEETLMGGLGGTVGIGTGTSRGGFPLHMDILSMKTRDPKAVSRLAQSQYLPSIRK